MGIESDINIQALRSALEREVQKNVHRVVASLQYIGEQVVNGIRDESLSAWVDQTGNLRSSVGYVIAIDGQPLNMYGFQKVDGPKRGSKEDPGYDSAAPRAYAQGLCSLYPKGIALIVVAGMEYAAYVEAMENKTVLAQGELEARRLVSEMITELDRRYSR